MEIKRDRQVQTIYSLHDARIKKIDINKDTVVLRFDYIFSYVNKEEQTYKADIIFTGDFSCDVLVFDNVVGSGKNNGFSGKLFKFEEFVKKYNPLDFEVLTEAYHGYSTIFEGLLYVNENTFTCMMSFWNDGEVIYKIYDKKNSQNY